jgi:hypothetical protein
MEVFFLCVVYICLNSRRWCMFLVYLIYHVLMPVSGGLPCGGGVEYLHRSPESRKRLQEGKSRIWDSKILLRVLRDSGPRMTALAKTSSNSRRQIRPLVRQSAPHQQTWNCLSVLVSVRKPQMGALFQDKLADWLSLVTWDSGSDLGAGVRS